MVKFRRMKNDRRRQIMEAALTRFARNGMSSVGITEITKTAGISAGTFYLYFENKEDLLLQLLDESVKILRKTLAEGFDTEGPPLTRFESAGRAFFGKFCNDHRDMLILFLRDSVGVNKVMEEKRKEIFQVLVDDVAGAINQVTGGKGRGPNRRAQVLAVSIFGMLERVAYHYYIWQSGSKDLRKVEEEALAFIRDGLGSILP